MLESFPGVVERRCGLPNPVIQIRAWSVTTELDINQRPDDTQDETNNAGSWSPNGIWISLALEPA